MDKAFDHFDIGPQSDEFEYPYDDLDGYSRDMCLPFLDEDDEVPMRTL